MKILKKHHDDLLAGQLATKKTSNTLTLPQILLAQHIQTGGRVLYFLLDLSMS